MVNSILVTGAAGFIGAALIENLLHHKFNIIGIDDLNDYYSVSLKKERLKRLYKHIKNVDGKFKFFEVNLLDKDNLEKIFLEYHVNIVINLAAQAGVRNSIKNPRRFIDSNIVGFHNILFLSVKFGIEHFVYASSSSVYGGNTKLPFSEDQNVSHPVSLYAATKKSNELIAHSYSHIYKLPTTALRFFTVYGPWGRPDMAPMLFIKSIIEKHPIKVFNNGNMTRDFTYIDDIAEAIVRCSLKPATIDLDFDSDNPNPSTSLSPFRIFNIGNSNPIKLLDFIDCLEKHLGIKAIKNFEELQVGDVVNTFANTKRLESWINYKPHTSLDEGIEKFVNWYKDFFV